MKEFHKIGTSLSQKYTILPSHVFLKPFKQKTFQINFFFLDCMYLGGSFVVNLLPSLLPTHSKSWWREVVPVI